MTDYRLSLDLGTNSIGWCALQLKKENGRLTPASILDMGVRIFPDGRNPQDGTSNAEARRAARGMRRNRDRYLERRSKLLKTLVRHGLMPQDERERRALAKLDPYELRNRGVMETLTPYEFGRAIFHLNQRRGFKSNRKSDSKENDVGAIKKAVKELEDLMNAVGADTFGQYLYQRRESGECVRSRLMKRKVLSEKGKEKKEDYYEFYPSRDALEHEFNQLWSMQAPHHPQLLTDAAKGAIYEVIFYQRPLKPPVVGDCLYERNEKRAAKALPIMQRFRIYQELNNLHVLDENLKSRPLTIEQRDKLASLLCQPNGKKKGKSELTFDRMRKVLKINDSHTFSHESERRKSLEADHTSALMAHVDRFGGQWNRMTDDEQELVLENLMQESDEEALIEWLMQEWRLDRNSAETISVTPLPQGYGRIGRTAARKIVAELVKDVVPYSEAVVRAGYASHSQFDTNVVRERLPYYGEVLERHVIPDPEKGGHPAAPLEQRFGRLGNPTVHIALNQLRKVVNEVIKIHGKPTEIHLEVLRDLKNSLRKRKELEKIQNENQQENEACRQILEERDERVNRENIQRLRLWREMPVDNRCCVYTGEPISKSKLLSEEVEIDHILPFSKTWDDSMANKVLCMRRANRAKSNKSPFQKWGNEEQWADISARCQLLPQNKRWRFTEDALERWDKEGGFLARQLTDSQYIAKLARTYLCSLFAPEQSTKVLCLPGRLTGLFRKRLGLETILDNVNPKREQHNTSRGEKNRADHRHHAIDALVVGVMDRTFLRRAATINARLEEQGVYRLLEGMQDPWQNFHNQAREALMRIIVSHKPDHGIAGALHNMIAYGFAQKEDPRGNAIHRVSVDDITLKNLQKIKGKKLRADLLAYLSGCTQSDAFQKLEELDNSAGRTTAILAHLCGVTKPNDKSIAKAIHDFFAARGIRRVKIIEQITLKGIRDRQGRVYKGYKPDGNAYLDIYLADDGKEWKGELVTRFDANLKAIAKQDDVNLNRQNITRLFNRDMLELEHQGERKIFYVQKMSGNQIALAEHYEANADSRTRDKDDPFCFIYKTNAESLRKSKVRFLTVTPAGRIRYLSDISDDSQVS